MSETPRIEMTEEEKRNVIQRIKNKEITFDSRHVSNEKYDFDNNKPKFLIDVYYGMGFMQSSAEIKSGKPHPKQTILTDVHCYECNQSIDYWLDGNHITPIQDTPCFTQTQVITTIDVPSGELIIADWFEHGSVVMGHLDKPQHNINSSKGKAERIIEYARENVAHFFVGNSSPHVFQKDNELVIGNTTDDENGEEIPLGVDLINKGYVCTDLWWTTICDKQVFEELARKNFDNKKARQITDDATSAAEVIVYVEPGTYELTYYLNTSEDNQLYATLRKI